MKITPLAADSLGTRSIATLVETRQGLKILLDPGVSLGPSRYGLPPHELEYKAYSEQWKRVVSAAITADVLVVTHYHYDHYNPFENLDIYKGKIVFVKHPTESINLSQKNRAKDFLLAMQFLPERLEYADNKEFIVKGVKIRFSKPVFHGDSNNKLGYVLMVSIDDGESKFVFSSDAEGPVDRDASDWIISESPSIVYLDGLATIFLGWKEDPCLLDAAISEELKILRAPCVKTIILDHHLVRDLSYRDKIKPLLDEASKLNKRVITAAEYTNKKPRFLEAKRKELYKEKPAAKPDSSALEFFE